MSIQILYYVYIISFKLDSCHDKVKDTESISDDEGDDRDYYKTDLKMSCHQCKMANCDIS